MAANYSLTVEEQAAGYISDLPVGADYADVVIATMSEPDLLIENPAGGVALLRLNRPEKKNALATPLLIQLADAFDEAAADATIRCVILTGGMDVFAAGAEYRRIGSLEPEDPAVGPRQLAWERIRGFAKPLIAAVEGWCLGAAANC